MSSTLQYLVKFRPGEPLDSKIDSRLSLANTSLAEPITSLVILIMLYIVYVFNYIYTLKYLLILHLRLHSWEERKKKKKTSLIVLMY